MKPIRTAIIGLGYWGPNLLRNFAAQPACEMVWGCDLNDDNLTKAAAHYPSLKTTTRIEDVLTDPSIEFVLIATPPSTHKALAIKALKAGKHVLVEKPIATTIDDANAMINAAKAAGKLLMVDHPFAYAPAVEYAVDLINRKSIGELLYFDSVRINLGLIQSDTNVLWDLAVHDLTILAQLKDLSTVRTVTAHGQSHFGEHVEDAHLHLTFEDRFTAHIHVSWLSPVKIRRTIIGGSNAMITYDDIETSEKIRVYDRGIDHHLSASNPLQPTYRIGNVLIPALPAKETLSLEAAHVLSCVQGKERPRVTGESGRDILAILEAADTSIKKRSTITLNS